MKYYVYACAKDINELFEKINKLIDLGFEPVGSIFYDSEGVYNYQTLTKDSDGKKKAEKSYYDYLAEHEFAIEEEDDEEDLDSDSGEELNEATIVTSAIGVDYGFLNPRTQEENEEEFQYAVIKSFSGFDNKERLEGFCKSCEKYIDDFRIESTNLKAVKEKYEEAKCKLKSWK